MLTCNCPRCGETIGLPTAAVPADATAQCPWCGELYPASEIIEKLPPMVELISADGQPLFLQSVGDAAAASPSLAAAPIASAASGSDSFESSLASNAQANQLNETWDDNTELTIEADGDAGFDLGGSLDSDLEHPEDDFDDAGQDGNEMMDFLSSNEAEREPSEAAAPLMPMKVKSIPVNTYKRKKSSPIKTLIGVAMGPLVALPLAGGILLWLGKAPDLGFWPFDGSFNNGSSSRVSAAPPMAQSNPVNPVGDGTPLTGSEMMVPAADPSDEHDRAQQELANLGAEPNPAESADGAPGGLDMPSLGTSLKPNSDDGENELATGEVEYPDDIAVNNDVVPQDVVADKVPMEMPEVALTDVAGNIESILADDTAVDMPSIDDQAPVAQDAPVAEEVMEPAIEEVAEPDGDAATVAAEPAEVAEPAAATEPSEVEAAVAKANKLLASLMKFEGTEGDRRRLLAKAYASVSAVAIESDAADNSAVQKLLNALSRSPLVKDLGDAADLWLDYGKRPTDGVLIIGAPATNASGSVLRIPSSSGDIREVSVSGSSLPEAEQVIALGRIVQQGDSRTVELVAVQDMNP
ncbi:hypothetical protein [Novipirellula sp.]|uniref:hypothetical protein n=1 Tax=Novipirellula sp. TaxID=2795430 RepID=UPI0035674B34